MQGGLTNAGAAYCWGTNDYGQLGVGTRTQSLEPTVVSGGLRFASLKVGWHQTCGITIVGAAYCWGSTDYGQLGDGTTNNRLVPTAVRGGLAFRVP